MISDYFFFINVFIIIIITFVKIINDINKYFKNYAQDYILELFKKPD